MLTILVALEKAVATLHDAACLSRCDIFVAVVIAAVPFFETTNESIS